MSIEVPGLRPAVIDKKTYGYLEEYLRFRHLQRNIYGYMLEWERMEPLVKNLPVVLEKLAIIDVRARKIIHDSILGSNLFYPHEIAILDLPIIQRLRRVNQVDVVPLVFPSGNHNRFEHTLGVAVIGKKLIKALFDKIADINCLGIKGFNNKDECYKYYLDHVRMAAILHDCGHGPFSHMSEQVYKHFPDIKEAKQTNSKLNGASYHEILSVYSGQSSQSFQLKPATFPVQSSHSKRHFTFSSFNITHIVNLESGFCKLHLTHPISWIRLWPIFPHGVTF